MSGYYSQRNTNAREHNFYGNGVRVPVEGPRGPSGPSGPVGPRGRDGLDGNHGLDGNADFMFLDAIANPPTTYGATNFEYNIYGSIDMLADHRCIRSQGTSAHVYNGNHHVRSIALLFKPGVYRFTLNARHGHLDEYSFGFDVNHNHVIGYMNGNEDPWSPEAAHTRAPTVSYTYMITNNTNFYFIERTNVSNSSYFAQRPQMIFERLGHVEESGNDDVLHGYMGVPVINTQTINGGLYWGQAYQAPPATHHPSNVDNNPFAVVELAAENGMSAAQQAFGWIHRIKRFF